MVSFPGRGIGAHGEDQGKVRCEKVGGAHVDGLLGVGGGALGGGVEPAEGVGAAGGGLGARARPQRVALLRQVPVRERVAAAPARRPPHPHQRAAQHRHTLAACRGCTFRVLSDVFPQVEVGQVWCTLVRVTFFSSRVA